ncbi:nitric-oxide reductase large subunit [Ectothiorhodospiraceae bacterium WFHF3C12]|nr:nitric-oxide reductase large subunit [Ectothiorhodospiraceae bacterium WFHF3C12]
MQSSKRLWWILGVLFIVSFGALGLIGGEIYQKAPPVPEAVVTQSGETVYTRDDIQRGRQVWQSIGGQQLGSIWGHGGYLAPDWTADWLHREAEALLDIWAAREAGVPYAELSPERQAALQARLQAEMRANTYYPETGNIIVSDDRAAAMREVAAHYVSLFGSTPELHELREQYAIQDGAIRLAEHRELMPAFFFWTAWAATTERPDSDITYTANWPHEPLVGNTPTTATGVWSIASVILLLAGVGAMVWYHAAQKEHQPPVPPKSDPLRELRVTPSMRATAKYFYTVIALFLLQMTLGAITAHYAVEGHEFYGYNLSEILPYSVTRTWHTQLGIFWIATAWLATGLYIAPAISGYEPKFQRLGVNLLYVALLVVVLGSMAGEWLAVQQVFDLDTNFYLGHQGWEFVDLGRVWQLLLFGGLMIWLGLMGRSLWPALRAKSENSTLLWLLFLSTVAIGLFYGAGLTWGKHTHISMVEYWRWWVVHLWVEGFFEVFATAVIALLFNRLGLVGARSANNATLFATIIFLFGGILGTLHHLYFAGTTEPVIAIGAVMSALEVVPLVLLGIEAVENYRHTRAVGWMRSYRWPVMFFVAVAFWNLVGAGLFGFIINPPIALYYIQGLNTTANHAHAALFGVYGMLGIGLMLFCLKGLTDARAWKDRLLAPAFWLLNGGLAAMTFFSLLPAGIYQAWASVAVGLWYARSPEIVQSPLMDTFVWMRVPGDIIFAAGAVLLAVFALRLWWGNRRHAMEAATAETSGAGGALGSGAPAAPQAPRKE